MNQYHRFRDLLYLGKYLNISNDLNNNLIEFIKHSFSAWIDNNSDISKVGCSPYLFNILYSTWILQWLPSPLFLHDIKWTIFFAINQFQTSLFI